MKRLSYIYCWALLAFGQIFSGNTLWTAEPKVFLLPPEKSLAEVRDEIRNWRNEESGRAEVPVTVEIASGERFLNEPVVFGPADSNVRYRAKEPGKAVFTRTKKLDGAKLNDKGWLEIKVPADCGRPETLFVDSKRATLARTPNEFYYYVESAAERLIDPATGKEADFTHRAFVPRKENLPLFETLAAKDPAKYPLSDIRVKFYFSWESSLHRLERWTPDNRTISVVGPACWRLDAWGGNLRYQLENFYEALDAPGEFYLDPDGTLSYVPLPGQTPENTVFRVPVCVEDAAQSGFLTITGEMKKIAEAAKAKAENPDAPEADSACFVRNLVFDGLTFRGDAFRLPPNGLMCGQAAVTSPSAILIDGGKNVRLENIEVGGIGGYAVFFRNGCSDGGVFGSTFESLGAGGVRIGGTPPAMNVTADNNIIRDYGLVDAGAVGVWVAGAQHCAVTHNDISDGFYTGVSVGWVWGYRPSPTHHNKIEFNHIHHIGKGVLSDMGGVYSLGISPGTTVSNNVIHDVYSYNRSGRGGWGLYTDEGSSEMTMENNLVYRVHTGMFHQHYGRENIVRNNILAFSLDGQIQRSRIEEHTSFTFENNIVLWDNASPLLASNWKDGHYVTRNNLYWFCGKKETEEQREEKFFAGTTLAEWQKLGRESGSVLADPGFVDAEANDFRFVGGEPNAAVQSIGFKPFDFTRAGTTSAEQKKRAADYAWPEVRFAPDPPPPPPFTLDEKFESLRNTAVPGGVINAESVDGAFSILEEGGNHFLRLTDSDRFKYSFNPHFYYHPSYTEGGADFSFDVRISSGAILHVEGRNLASPYRIGPSLRFVDGKMSFRGANPCAIPIGEWFRVRVRMPLGEGRAKSGTVKVMKIAPDGGDGEPILAESPLEMIHDSWTTLNWLGFCGLGKSDAAIDLDNIELKQRP